MIELILIEVYQKNSNKKISNFLINKKFEKLEDMDKFVNNLFFSNKLYKLYPFYRIKN